MSRTSIEGGLWRAVRSGTGACFVGLSIGCGGGANEAPSPPPDLGSPDAREDTALHLDGASDAPARPDAVGTADATDGHDADDGLVPMFVAQGYVGRTTVSCDDGKTWVADRSDDDAVRCFAAGGGPNCDHDGSNAMGLAYGHGVFVGTWGWGAPNSVRRSVDGVRWEHVRDGTIFSGLEYGAGRFVAIDGRPQVSTDDGKTWTTAAADLGFLGHIRRTGFAARDGGLFLAAGGENGATRGDLMLSSDGLSWRRPTTVPDACGLGAGASSFALGGGVIVLGHETGVVCRSTDGARTWTTASTGGALGTALLWDGAAFVGWGTVADKPVRFRSPDGVAWTTEPTAVRAPDGSTRGGPSLASVARSDAGTYVATNAGWMVWYEKQEFYRSRDGVTWDALAAGSFHGSHPIKFITYGRGARSDVCR